MNKTTEELKLAKSWVEWFFRSNRSEHAPCSTTEALFIIREVLADHGSPDWLYEAMTGKPITDHSTTSSKPITEPVKQEPVAYVYDREIAGIGYRKDVAFIKNVEIGTDLYAAPVDAKAIRAEAYQQGRNEMKEEAAKVQEQRSIERHGYDKYEDAAAIRGLK